MSCALNRYFPRVYWAWPDLFLLFHPGPNSTLGYLSLFSFFDTRPVESNHGSILKSAISIPNLSSWILMWEKNYIALENSTTKNPHSQNPAGLTFYLILLIVFGQNIFLFPQACCPTLLIIFSRLPCILLLKGNRQHPVYLPLTLSGSTSVHIFIFKITKTCALSYFPSHIISDHILQSTPCPVV